MKDYQSLNHTNDGLIRKLLIYFIEEYENERRIFEKYFFEKGVMKDNDERC